jgi:hypothetical protein
MDRRGALALFGLTIGAERLLSSAVAQEMVQADTKAQTPPSAANVEPALHVNGEYQAVYQEGYAQAFLELGFSEEFLLQMFSEATDSLRIKVTPKAVILRAKAGNSRLAPPDRSKCLVRQSRTDMPASINQTGL